ncbi:MAG: hypothetical protein Q7K26_02540 [bacterium]|nr:hypothetical protein [bacterium]
MEDPSYRQVLQLDENWNALKRRLDKESAQRLNRNFNLVHAIAGNAIDAQEIENKFSFELEIDHSLSLEERILLGKFDGYDGLALDFKKNFPVEIHPGKTRVRVGLVPLKLLGWTGTPVVNLILNSQGLTPATVVEQLAFAAKYPKVQLELDIAATGSCHRESGFIYVPVLCATSKGQRKLLTHWTEWTTRTMSSPSRDDALGYDAKFLVKLS